MTKKTFKNKINPAMQYISTADYQTNDETNKIPDGYKINTQYIEKRNRRVHLLIQQSLYNKINEKSTAENRSINDLIHSILEESLGR